VFDSTPVAQQLTLRITNNSSFLTDLDWSGLPSNIVGQYVLNIKRSTGEIEAIQLPSSTTTYTDTVVDFGIVNTYFVDAFTTDLLDLVESNFVSDTLPAIIQPLQLNYVCYDPASDSLTWSVSNPNPKDHPFIYAQWWNAQRDTLYAQAGGTVTFKTKNNPQNPGTFGDDNITGIWWIDQTLTPGQPNDIVFNIPLSQSCAGLRMANTSPAQKAGSIFEGTLGNYLKVNVEAQDLLTGQVQIAPNPVSERLTIHGLQLEGKGSVQITNTLGQVVFEQSVELQKEISLNLQILPVGTYIMTLKTPVGNVSEKILKE
ncbi:MAG: T9SS type A sorting domain-containing protein, partial [Bacteroidota bacterium]